MSSCFIMSYHTINLGLIPILATFLLSFCFKNRDLPDIQLPLSFLPFYTDSDIFLTINFKHFDFIESLD